MRSCEHNVSINLSQGRLGFETLGLRLVSSFFEGGFILFMGSFAESGFWRSGFMDLSWGRGYVML